MDSQTLPQLIDKEAIQQLTFSHTEPEVQNPLEVQRQLTKAMILGNSHKHKVKLIFDSDGGLKMVETTIWGLSDQRVILKKGLSIPIDNIIEVRLL